MIAFADLPSRTPDAPMRTSERIDVYYGGVWQPRSAMPWSDHRSAKRQHANGLARIPASFLIDKEAAWATARIELHRKLRALSVLDSFRTATSQQLAAITGNERMARPSSQLMQKMFAMGLVEFARPSGAFRSGSTVPAMQAWRLSSSGQVASARLMRELMTWPEWALTTGGRPWVTGRQSSRHDILSLELMLRAAEFAPQVAGVAGEKFSGVREALFDSWGVESPIEGARAAGIADGMLVRRDGLRVLLETTASAPKGDHRAENYARMFQFGGTADQGSVVLFVVAAHQDDNGLLSRQVRKTISHAIRKFPDAHAERRMFVVDWRDWFPAEGHASDAFLELRAERYDPTSSSWLPVMLASVGAKVPEGAAEVPGRLARLYQSPHWLRERARPLPLMDVKMSEVWGQNLPMIEPVASLSPVPAAARIDRLVG